MITKPSPRTDNWIPNKNPVETAMAGRGKKKEIETYDGSTPLKSMPRVKVRDAIRQELVISNLLQGMTDWDAYRGAGYKAKNPTAGLNQLRKNTKFMARLAFKRGQLAQKLDISAERVLLERARIAFADPAEMFDKNGVMLPIHDIPEDIRRAISGVDVEELFEGRGKNRKKIGEVVKPRLWNKNDALESLEKQLGLFKKDNEQTRPFTLMEILAIVDGSCQRNRIEAHGSDSSPV